MMKNEKLTIVILDDHQLFIDGLLHIFKDDNNFEVIGVFNESVEFLKRVEDLRPNIIILDIQINEENGFEIFKRLKEFSLESKILFISMFNTQKNINKIVRMKADGFLSKNSTADEVKTTIKQIIGGDYSFSSNNNEIICVPYPYLLSEREIEIIQLIKKGFTSKKIAYTLSISEFTVETHRKNIFKKVQVSSVSELISFCYDKNI